MPLRRMTAACLREMLPSLIARSVVLEPRPMMNWSFSIAIFWLLKTRNSVWPGLTASCVGGVERGAGGCWRRGTAGTPLGGVLGGYDCAGRLADGRELPGGGGGWLRRTFGTGGLVTESRVPGGLVPGAPTGPVELRKS